MKRTTGTCAILALLLTLPALPAGQGQQSAYSPSAIRQPAFKTSVAAITAARLRDYLTFVASDEMEGRLTPSRGLDTTARFLAALLARSGAKPAGDEGSFFQRIVLRKEKVAPGGAAVKVGEQSFVHAKDFVAAPVAGTVSGAMIFAGDGWFVKAKNLDPYQGLDPKGKVVIIATSGLPGGVTAQELMAGKAGEDWMDPVGYARAKGAIGVIQVTSLLVQANPDSLQSFRERVEAGSFAPEKLSEAEGRLPTIYASARLVQAIFAREAVDGTAVLMSFPNGKPVKPFALSADKTIWFSVKTAAETTPTQNVVAIVEGSDPKLSNEYVALGAHYDHSGTRTGNLPPDADRILNGADDNGTGTVALLAMAEALAAAPKRPRRSALFVWHAGEEMGLWGSQYYTTFPTVTLDRIAAQLNIDMIGRSRAPSDDNPRNRNLSGPNEVYVIGSKMMSTELGALSDAVNDRYLNLDFNYRYDDPKDPEQFFYRSDHIHYARKGIPIIFYFTGVHADYHQAGDEVSRIDFAKYEKVARTIYATFWEIAEMAHRPVVDKTLPAEARH